MTHGRIFDIIYIQNGENKNMENIDFAYLLFLVVAVVGSYLAGKKEGIGVTLDYMRDQGHIDFED